MLNNERRLWERDEPLLNPLFDMAILLSSGNSSRPWNLRLRQFPGESFSPSLFYCTFLLFYFDVRENWLPVEHPVVSEHYFELSSNIVPNIT
jgi:hypothetical protein